MTPVQHPCILIAVQYPSLLSQGCRHKLTGIQISSKGQRQCMTELNKCPQNNKHSHVFSPGLKIHSNASRLSGVFIKWTSSCARHGWHCSNHSSLAKKASRIPNTMDRPREEADNGTCEGIKRPDLYGKGSSKIFSWAYPKDKPCVNIQFHFRECPKRSHLWTLCWMKSFLG